MEKKDNIVGNKRKNMELRKRTKSQLNNNNNVGFAYLKKKNGINASFTKDAIKVPYNFKNNRYRNKVFGIKKKIVRKPKRLQYVEAINFKRYKSIRRKKIINKLKPAYIEASMRLDARRIIKKKKGKKKQSLALLNLNTKKFKFLARFLGMLTMRGNTIQLENSFLYILRKIKKIYLDDYTIRTYLTSVVNQARPFAIIVSQKKGSITYKIPLYTTRKREIFQGLYWLINESCGLKKGDFKYCLLKELIKLSYKIGKVMRIKANFHSLVQRNRSLIKKLKT